ncbi:MAG: YbhB/YbcL family Raf kinase inhibitor-like protein [Thermodesulfobacteriota bacterium]
MRNALLTLALVLALAAALPARAADFSVSSPAFAEGRPIPAAYACAGRDANPTLLFRNAPAGTRSLVLIMDDPDAPGGTWVHWLVYDIPAASSGLPENLPRTPQLPGLATQGRNSWGRVGYGGPCPPSGTHRYVFRLYALNVVLGLAPGAGREQLEAAMAGHVLGRAELLGVFGR